MESSKIALRQWAIAIYMAATNLKGVSSMKIHRELGMTQKSAWFLIQRVREFSAGAAPILTGPVEVDETYVGGLEKNRHKSEKMHAGRGTAGKATVMGARQLDGKIVARPLGWEPGETLAGFVHEHVKAGVTLYTDDHTAYKSLRGRYDQTPRWGVRPGRCAHQRYRILLVDAETSAQRDVSQDQPQAPRPLRQRIRRAAQHSLARHLGANGRYLPGYGPQAAPVRRPDRLAGCSGYLPTMRHGGSRDLQLSTSISQ